MNIIDQYVIDFVRTERKTRGLSQVTIADMLMLERGFIGNIESPLYRAKYNLTHINILAWHWSVSPRLFLPERAFELPSISCYINIKENQRP